MTDLAALTALIEPEATALGLRLVRVAMIGGAADPTLQVMAEKPTTRQLDLGDCEVLSRRISDLLDREEETGRDPIETAYRLEVSSPGIDRPLTRLADYTDWAGHEARIRFTEPQFGAKQVSGVIDRVEGDIIHIMTTQGPHAVDYAVVASAKLLLTDKLINATAPLSTEGADKIEDEPSGPTDEMAEPLPQEI